MSKDTGGSAFGTITRVVVEKRYESDPSGEFPAQYRGEDTVIKTEGGMTLRDYFAAKAMQGWIATGDTSAADFNPDWEGYKKGSIPEEFTTLAHECYLMADAMIAERNKG